MRDEEKDSLGADAAAVVLAGSIDTPKLTHAALVEIAAKWLKRQGCNVVLTERGGAASGEIPDAIGWWCGGFQSAVIECKVSREDFLADFDKAHRAALSLGSVRFYLAPSGVIPRTAISGGWGLLEWTGSVVRRMVEPEPWRGQARSVENEARLLLSELRIFHVQGITYRKGEERWGETVGSGTTLAGEAGSNNAQEQRAKI